MGGKNSTTTSQVSIPPEVLARYNAVNTQAETVSKTPFQAFGSAPSDFVAQMNNQQGAGINRINETAGSYQPYMAGATGATLAGMAPASAGIDNYMSPYIKNVADTTGALMKQQQEQAQSGALGTAISSGAFGGDRAGIAAANLQQQNQMGYGKTMADIYNQGYTQALGASQADLGRQMQGGAQLAGLGAQTQELGLQGAQAQIAAGTMQQQTDQAGKDAMIKSFMQEKGYPFQVAQFLANIAMGTGALSGSTTTATQPTSMFGFFKDGGKVNGYAGGGGVSGPRTDSQSGMFEDGYVPPADLPIGQLMVADPPSDQGGGGGLGDVVKIVSSIGGMKNGGVAGGRHGYATDGYVGPESAEEARRRYQEGELSVFDSLLANSPASAASPRNIGQVMPPAGGLVPYTPPPVTPSEAPAGLGASSVDPTPRMVYSNPNPPETGEAPTGLGAGRVDETPRMVYRGPPSAMSETPMGQPESGVSGLGLAPIGASERAPAPALPSLGDLANVRVGNMMPAADKSVPMEPAVDPTIGGDAMRTLGMAPIQEVKAFPEAPSSTDAVFNRMIRQESGGNQLRPDGSPLTSPKGAVGAAQVMEATGPEAAKLAGLPWDRDRWMYDKEYNLALGKAYYLDQVRRFGDPIKAAAAYNAGPTRLAQAMDRATALGGSYLDYLPEETQNYVRTVSGQSGVGGVSGSAGSDGLGAANMPQEPRSGGLGGNDPLRINKPYEDRNLIGKFFHDRETGKLNPDAVLSLLSGLGAMGQARTVSPIGAILAGLGAGAGTYADLREKAPPRVAQNLKNNQAAVAGYQMYQMGGGKLPYSEWAKTLPAAGTDYLADGDGGQTGTTASPTGKIGYNQLMSGTVMIGGSEVPMFNDPNSLRQYINENSIFRGMEGNPIAGTLANAEARLAEIEARGGVTFDKDGNEVVIPSYVSAGNQIAENAANREATIGFRAAGAERIPQIDQQMAEIGKQAVIFSNLEGSAFNTEKASIQAALGAAGFDVPDSVATTQQAIKIAASQMLGELGSGNLPGGAPAAELSRLQQIVADPDLQPEAIKTILSMKKAQLMRERDRYDARAQWEASNGEMNDMDQLAYEQWFAENRPFEAYLKEAHDSFPIFAGEIGSKQKPYPVNNDAEFDKVPFGSFFTGPDGVIRQNTVRGN